MKLKEENKMTVIPFKKKEEDKYKANPHYRLGIAYSILKRILNNYDLTSSDDESIKQYMSSEDRFYNRERK